MKRGIIRIISGSIMILFQVLGILGQISREHHLSSIAWNNIGYYIGFYATGILGVILLIFGIRAYSKGMYSQLVLHTRNRRMHTVIKWAAVVITTLLFVNYLLLFIDSSASYTIYNLLMIFATLSFALYLLFYLYKKPSCLFSTFLILIGTAHLFDLFINIPFYMLDLPEYDFLVSMIAFNKIPSLVAGILYIVIACKLYRESFSIKTIKIIGWIVFAMEVSSKILYPILVGVYYYFYDLGNLLYCLLTIVLLLYISVFNINTLKGQAIFRITDTIAFCRKCGNKLFECSRFCDKCGNKIIEESKGEDNGV